MEINTADGQSSHKSRGTTETTNKCEVHAALKITSPPARSASVSGKSRGHSPGDPSLISLQLMLITPPRLDAKLIYSGAQW